MTTVRFLFPGGRTGERLLDIPSSGELRIPASEIPQGAQFVEIHSEPFTASAGEDGYFVIPSIENNGHAALTTFRERPDTESVFDRNTMPVYAVRHGEKGCLAVVAGMSLEYALVVGVRENAYYLYPRFLLEDGKAYEDIVIRFFELTGKDANYSGAARRYRAYQLERGACIPLKERSKRYPVLAEAARGPEVRIRLAWKPVPPPVLEQTEENEPPIHVAITFERAEQILDEFHRQGIRDAEFCLVGWNKSGHDGRFPDLFPVEPLLGGEEALLRLIRKAKDYGYLICGHTNVLDSYTIAKRWNREYVIRDKNGELHKEGQWGGGQSYRLCPREAHEKIAVQDFKDMKRLGFRGTHYLDVMSIVIPDPCYHPDHPLTRKAASEWRGKTLELARESVGASGSEGAWDFCIGSYDYALYTVFNRAPGRPEICDRFIPFWHLVYHGILLYNSFCDSVNEAIKSDPRIRLMNLEYGGRPLAYFYAKFMHAGRNWMGNEDLGCETDEELRNGVAKLKEEYDFYRTIRDLQFEFMEEHEEIAEGVSCSSYSDGSRLLVNYRDTAFSLDGRVLPPLSCTRL